MSSKETAFAFCGTQNLTLSASVLQYFGPPVPTPEPLAVKSFRFLSMWPFVDSGTGLCFRASVDTLQMWADSFYSRHFHFSAFFYARRCRNSLCSMFI